MASEERGTLAALDAGRGVFRSQIESHQGRVIDLAGPWRTSGAWWTVENWQRDEWDIALSDGAIYRLYCSPGGWFVEGSYD